MRFWFDTEFYEDGKTIELISIGVVSEDGREYYAETLDAVSLSHKSLWLRDNVFPHLSHHGSIRSPSDIQTDLILFCRGEKPEIWAYYADYDWVALCQIFGTMMNLPPYFPKYCRDVKQLCDSLGNPTLPKQLSQEHNALADARWTKEAWEFLQKVKP